MANTFRQEYDLKSIAYRGDRHILADLLGVATANQIERECSLVVVEFHHRTLHATAIEPLLRNREALVVIAAPRANDRRGIDGRLGRIDVG